MQHTRRELDALFAPREFDGEIYEPRVDDARIAYLRDGIDAALKAVPGAAPLFMGHTPYGRSLAEVTCENYRILLRRIDELDADIDDLVAEEVP